MSRHGLWRNRNGGQNMDNGSFPQAVAPAQVIRYSVLKSSLYVWLIAALAGLLHLAVAGRYDIFRNELYFIVCGRHPAFGYADQPPLVPLLAAATQIAGINLWMLRLPAVVAAVALVPLVVAFVQLLGGSRRAAWLAAIA